MVTHDKFCDEAENFDDGWVCICDVLIKVRLDEREQVAQRIADLHTRVPGGCADEECWRCAVDDYCSECSRDFPCKTIAIVRGGEQA